MENLFYEAKPVGTAILSYYALTAGSMHSSIGKFSGFLLAFCTIAIMYSRFKHRSSSVKR